MKKSDNKNILIDEVRRETQAYKFWKKDNFGKGDEDQEEDGGYAVVPFVYINNRHIEYSSIQYFKIRQTGFTPTITIEFADEADYFNSVNSIKSGDIISVVLLSPGDTEKYKPICCDFNVTSIRNISDPSDSGSDTNFGGCFRVKGVLNINEVAMHRSYALKDMTSFEAMRTLAKKCGISFASNVDATNDRQTWVNCNDPLEVFMEKITQHAYIDDTCFFHSFIDLNYCLNFIEVDRMYTQVSKGSFPTDTTVYMVNYIPDDVNQKKDDTSYRKECINMITNASPYMGYNNYWTKFNVSTSNDDSRAYREYCRYYDLKGKEYIDEFAEGQNHQTEGMIALNKGRVVAGKDWMLENLYTFTDYISTDDSNVHPNYNIAETINRINMEESQNYSATVRLSGNCFNLQMYSPVWVDYYDKAAVNLLERSEAYKDEDDEYTKDDDTVKPATRVDSDNQKREIEANQEDGTDISSELYNPGMSGCYVVTGITYEYEDAAMTEEITITRREAAPNTRYYETKEGK